MWWLGASATAIALAGCQERLTQPGECPALCPGGVPEVVEEVLEAAPQLDSTFSGYAERGQAQVLLVSSGVPSDADTNFAVLVFNPRPDEIRFRDTLRSYTIDSIRLGIGLIARDTAVNNLRFELYRLPPTLDTAALSYDGIRPLFGPAAAVIAVPDTALRSPWLQRTVADSDWACERSVTARLEPGSDSGTVWCRRPSRRSSLRLQRTPPCSKSWSRWSSTAM